MTTDAKLSSYEKTIEIQASPDQVFEALTLGMDRWWTAHTKGILAAVGDTVRVEFPPHNGYWTFEAMALEPCTLVELRCTDAFHAVSGQPESIEQEWLGTTLRWRIASSPAGSKLHFRHEGLSPELHCYDICSQGWDFFFAQSLAAHLNDGEGMPHQNG